MSRWSQEEDTYILEFIQEVNDDINYKELVETHNKRFNSKRTEETYKVRVRKVAKDNDIVLKSKIFWSESDKTKLIKLVNENPLNVDWASISKLFNRTELSVRTMYNELVPVDKHIESCMNTISEEDIKQVMNNLEHKCSNCNKNMYCQPLLWENMEYCEECHYKSYNDKIKDRWILISEYSCKVGKDKCNICNKKCDFTQTSVCKFNYDHKNMFEKSNTIFSMNKQGIDLSYIYKEIDLCQLLCVSCHNIVTSIEQKTGFNRIKINMTREYNKTNDIENKNNLIKQYSDIYEKYMNNIYEIVRKLI
jgi:hypothetical protein